MLITRATLLDGTRCDIRVAQTITDVAPRLRALTDEHVYDAALGTVLPGLHDHHVHLRSAAAALDSVAAGPPQVRDVEALRHALRAAVPGADGWLRAVGYHDSVAGDLDRRLLDDVSPQVPVRVQHRSGAMWILNSAALQRIGAPDHPDGRFFRADPAIPRSAAPGLRRLSEALTARGVTGVTDATPGYTRTDVENFTAARRSGDLRQRLHCMAAAGTPATAHVSIGPAKFILDDTTLDLDALCHDIAANHAAGHPVAVHCVTASQLVVAVAALRATGVHPGDRIEHAAMVPSDCIADVAGLGVTVVTQPNFVAERGDEYLTDVPPSEYEQLWRVASLRAAGIPVALSTDTPFGDGDPWASMRAAVTRKTPGGVVLGATECVTPATALAMFLGAADTPARPRRVAVGEPGDLCVLTGTPAEVLAELDGDRVVATIIGGQEQPSGR
ncbi:MAG TPA: amidohydrolase family protein [Mycobacterium sp.]|nr:amidohydrolase family protein [Mycobacterium sp.]